MDVLTLTAILFGSFVVALVLGLPVAFSLGFVGVFYALILWGPESVLMSAFSSWSTMWNFILIAIPLFILMGNLLEKSGVAEKLFETLYLWLGPLTGGLAIGVVLIGAIMGAMVGLIGASIFTIGLIAIPAMRKRNYEKHMIMGPLMAGATLAQLIPPSTLMLTYAAVTQISAGKIFIGGVIPGIILASLFSLFIFIRCRLNPELAPPIAVEDRGTWGQKFSSLTSVILPVFIIVSVIGSIFLGLATPTEAAAVGVMGAALSAALHRKLTWEVVKNSVVNSTKLFGMIMWILIGADIFSRFYIAMGASYLITELVFGLEINPWLVMISMQILLIFLGMVMEDMAIIMIAAPIFSPIIIGLGFDPLWFAIIFMINLQISQLTPPYGFALFYGKTLVPEESMGMIWRSVIPFVPLQLIGLVLCMVFPQLATWLPNLMFRLIS